MQSLMSSSHHHLGWTRLGILAGLFTLIAASVSTIACGHSDAHQAIKGAVEDPDKPGLLRVTPRYVTEGKLPTEALVPTVTDITGDPPAERVVPGTESCDNDPVRDLYITDPDVGRQASELLNRMRTVEQRVIQLTGKDRPNYSDSTRWQDIQQSRNDPVLGIRGYQWRDGPHGINLEAGLDWRTGNVRRTTLKNYSTSFPTSVAQGASFDIDLMKRVGEAMGDETVASGHNVLLGPCMNLLRNPLWGRAQETFGEDVFHLGRIATAYTWGLQEHVTGCAKHYIANNIELQRMYINATMDQRTLREIYGRHFEMVSRDGGIGCMMASYNLVNGRKSTQNEHLLTTVLKRDYGFRGFVLTDWWAMPATNNGQGDANTVTDSARVAQEGILAGTDVEVPWALNYYTLPQLLDQGLVPWSVVDGAVLRVLEQKLRFGTAFMNSPWGPKETRTGYDATTGSVTKTVESGHTELARESAEKGMVLLKNENQTLPIPASAQTVAIIGAKIDYRVESDRPREKVFDFARDVALGDRGSSRVVPDPLLSVGPFDGLTQAAPQGVNVVAGHTAQDAQNANADFIVVVVGLTAGDEGEEYTGAADRESLVIPPQIDFFASADVKAARQKTLDQNKLVMDVLALGKPTVVVIEAGGAVDDTDEYPWLDAAPALVMAWYPGQRGGEALGQLLFGQKNFAGRLPVTWPKRLEDFPIFSRGDQVPNPMEYNVGYRFFDEHDIEPRYPFGHGLSYTTFDFERLHIPCGTIKADGLAQVEVDVRNTGTRAGDEVILVFASYPQSQVMRSEKELKGFARVSLEPGQVKRVSIPLRVQDFRYWDDGEQGKQWVIESGPVNISVGPSSAADKLALTTTINVEGDTFK